MDSKNIKGGGVMEKVVNLLIMFFVFLFASGSLINGLKYFCVGSFIYLTIELIIKRR